MSKAEKGSNVSVHYTGKLSDGSVFDTSEEREPLQFVVGNGEVIPGFDTAVTGMAVGDSKTVTIPPEEAYGPHHEQMVMQVKMEELPEGTELGATLQASIEGTPVYFSVTDITDEMATLDGNHPLAGQELQFEIKLVELS